MSRTIAPMHSGQQYTRRDLFSHDVGAIRLWRLLMADDFYCVNVAQSTPFDAISEVIKIMETKICSQICCCRRKNFSFINNHFIISLAHFTIEIHILKV